MMKKNPRLIPVDLEAIAALSEKYVRVISQEAKEMVERYPSATKLPIGALDIVFPKVTVDIENLRRGATPKFLTIDIYTEYKRFGSKELEALQEGASFYCDADIVGGAVSSYTRRTKLVTVKWCSGLTLKQLSLAGKRVTKEVKEVLVHEMTHASEYGEAQRYPEGVTMSLGKDPRYYNHPWELRAFSRQVALEVENEYVADRIAGENLSEDIMFIIRFFSPTYRRIEKYLTPKSEKKLIQLVTRYLDEKGLLG